MAAAKTCKALTEQTKRYSPEQVRSMLAEQTKRYSPDQVRQMLTDGQIRQGKAGQVTQVATANAHVLGPPPLPARALPGLPPARDLPVIPGRRQPPVLIDLTHDKRGETATEVDAPVTATAAVQPVIRDTLVDDGPPPRPEQVVRHRAQKGLPFAQTEHAPASPPPPPKAPAGARAQGRGHEHASAAKPTLSLRPTSASAPMAGTALATPLPPSDLPRGTRPPALDMAEVELIDRRAGAFPAVGVDDDWEESATHQAQGRRSNSMQAPAFKPARTHQAPSQRPVSELQTLQGVEGVRNRRITTEAPAGPGVPVLLAGLVICGLLAGATSLHLVETQWWTPLAALGIAVSLAIAGGELLMRLLRWTRAPRIVTSTAAVVGTLAGLTGGFFVGAWAAAGDARWTIASAAEIGDALQAAVVATTELSGLSMLTWAAALAFLLSSRSAIAGWRKQVRG